MCLLIRHPISWTFFETFMSILYTSTTAKTLRYQTMNAITHNGIHNLSFSLANRFMPKHCPTNRHITVNNINPIPYKIPMLQDRAGFCEPILIAVPLSTE